MREVTSRASGQGMQHLINDVGETGFYLHRNKVTLLYVYLRLSLVNSRLECEISNGKTL